MPVSSASLLGAYLTTFALSITNPLTIFSFAAIFAGLGAAGAVRSGSAALLIAGVFAGSVLWWLLVCLGVGLFRSRVTPSILGWINRASGVLVFGFGVLALASVLG